jgi:hypothetical protein
MSIESDIAKMIDDRLNWQTEMKPFLPNAPASENKVARAALKNEAASFDVTEQVTTEKFVAGDLVFNRRHFARHWKKWENDDSDTCLEESNQEFDRLHELQNGAEDLSDGDSQVRTKNPKGKYVRESGTKSHPSIRTLCVLFFVYTPPSPLKFSMMI